MAAFPSAIPVALQDISYSPKYESDAIACVVQIEQTSYLPTRVEIEHNAHGATDAAQVTLPISNNPDFSSMFARSDGTNGMPNNANLPVYISIFAGYPTSPTPMSKDVSQLSYRFFGIVDLYSAVFLNDQVTFKCRNMAATLVDFPVTNMFMSQTSAELVASLASSLGLKTNILLINSPVTVQQVFASEFIGGANFSATVANIKAWDLLLKCALFDDVDVWVSLDKGGSPVLNYAAPSLIKRTTVNLKYGQSAIIDVTAEHSIQYAKNIRVEVHTYQKRIRQATSHRIDTDPYGGIVETPSTQTVVSSPIFGTSEQTATRTSSTGVVTTTLSSTTGGPATASTQPGSESAKERYVRYIPNLTPQMCQQVARSIWRQISMMEYRLNLSLPMTRDLLKNFDISMLLNVTGLPYKNANSVFSGQAPILNTATATLANGPSATSNPVVNPVSVDATGTDTRYWPRRITETIDPESKGWSLQFEVVNHAPPSGSV